MADAQFVKLDSSEDDSSKLEGKQSQERLFCPWHFNMSVCRIPS